MEDLQAHLERLAREPGATAALEAIEDSYRREGRWEELLRVYEDNADRASPGQVASLWRKAAQVCLQELASSSRAENYLQRAVEAEPDDLDSLHELGELYLARGDYEHGAKALENQIDRVDDDEMKSSLQVKLAALYSEYLDLNDKAIDVLRQAIDINPKNLDAYRSLATVFEGQGRDELALKILREEFVANHAEVGVPERLTLALERLIARPKFHDELRAVTAELRAYRPDDPSIDHVTRELDEFRERWSERAASLRERATKVAAQDKAEAAELWLSLAEILFVYGNDHEAALAPIDKALAGRPGHPVALSLLEEIYGAEGRFDDFTLKLEMMAAYTHDAKVSVELYLRAALCHSVQLDDREASVGLYKRVLEIDPVNTVASNALVEFYCDEKRWDQALNFLTDWGQRAESAVDKVAAYHRACRILEEGKGDPAAARPYYEAILELDGNHQAAAHALEQVYRDSGDHRELAKTLRAQLSGISDDERRQPILEELGELYASFLDEPGLALRTFGELYSQNPTAKRRERLEELAVSADSFVELARYLEAGLRRLDDDAERVDALHSLAALYEGAHQNALHALRIHRQILQINPVDDRALKGVERLLSVAAETTDKVEFYEEQAKVVQSDAERCTILLRLGDELVESSKDYARALDVYREVLKHDPSNEKAIDQLVSLYRREERWPEVADLLSRKIEYADQTERHRLALVLAEISETYLDDTERAARAYASILVEDADNDSALEGLEGLLPKSNKLSEMAELLEPIYIRRERWERAAAMIEVRVRSVEEPVLRAQMLRGLAEIYHEKQGSFDRALASLLRAFQSDPNQEGLHEELEDMAHQTGDFIGVIRAYRAQATVLEGSKQVELILRAARFAETCGDFSSAAIDYLRVFAADPNDDNDDSVLVDLSRVVRLGADSGDLVTTGAKIVESLEESDRLVFSQRLARWLDSEGRPREAISAWRMVLDVQQNDLEASQEIDRLFNNAADPSELVEHLRSKLAKATEDAEIKSLANQVADALLEKLNDPGAAATELAAAVARVPGQLELWRRLAKLRLELNDPVAAAEAMHREINLMPDTAERRTRLLDYADLTLNHLDDRAGALHALQGVIAVEPGNHQAVELLKQLYVKAVELSARDEIARVLLPGLGATEQWREAVGVLNHLLEGRDAPEERVALSKEIAAIQSERLGDAEAAYQALERAFLEAPGDGELRERLETFAAAAEAWPALASVYEAAISASDDARLRQALQRKLAEIFDQRLGRTQEAIEHYRAATDGGLPDDVESLEAMERLLRGGQQPRELAEVLSALAFRLDDSQVERRKTVLSELADLYAGPLNDPGEAATVLKQLIVLDERNPHALRQLDAMLAEKGEFEGRIDVLTQLVELGSANPEVVDDLIRLAQALVELERFDEALKYFRAALMKKRGHEGAIDGLESLILVAPNKLEVAQVLEPIYAGRQDHEKLAWVLSQRLAITEELPQRKALLRRIGDIYENRLHQKDRAFDMARRSLSEDPSDMGVRMWIEKIAGDTGALEPLAQAYVEEATKAEDALALQFHRRAAAIYHEKLQQVDAAVREYRAILELEGRDEKALSGLEFIFRRTENHEDLVELLQRRLENTAGLERRRDYLNDIASLQATQLGDLEGAVESFLRLLEITPEDPEVVSRIEELYRDSGNYDALEKFYRSRCQHLAEKRGKESAARRVEYLYRLGRLLDEQCGDHDGSVEAFRRALDEFPRHGQTIAYLHERAATGALYAISLLERVYRDLGEWGKYVDLLENRLQQTPESEHRREIYVAISDTYIDELNAGDLAFLALTRAYGENRTDIDLLDRLEALSERLGNWYELAEFVGADVDAVPDPGLRQELLHRLGMISGQKLGDTDRAVAFFERALQYDPRDEKALDRLDQVLVADKRWAPLADLLERRIELADEAGEKSRLLERLASIWGEQLHDAEAALRCHQQILSIDPDHPLTLSSMEKLHVELGDWDALAENLARQSHVLDDPSEQVRIHSAAGRLYSEKLNDYGLSIDNWLVVVQHEPLHEEANQALDKLFNAEQRWSDLAEHYQRQLKHTQSVAKKAELNQNLGVILGEKLGRGEEALESWLEVIETEPRNLEALQALLRLYAERAMWEEYVEVARQLIPITDPVAAKEVRFRLARALGENLGRRDEAIKLAREVRAMEPHTSDFMAGLAQVLVNIEAWDEAVIALEKAGALEEDDDVACDRYNFAAEIYREQLSKPNDARAVYEAIRERKPTDVDTYQRLAEVYRNTGEWRRLVALNEEIVAYADPALRLEVLTEIRDVQELKLAEKELAFIAACRVYKENPADLEAAKVIERIALDTDGADQAAAVLEDELEAVLDPDIRIALHRQLARIYTDHLKDLIEAERSLQAILMIQADDMEALDALTVLGAMEERPDKQLHALEAKLQHVFEDLSRKSILFDIARIWEDQIGDSDEAINAFTRVLEIDGADVTALDALARIYTEEDRWTELAHTITRKVELTQDPAENIQLRMQVAALCEGELDDFDAAIQWYRGVLEFESGHPAALVSLERLYTRLEQWSELVQIYDIQLAHTEGSEAQVRILNKKAMIYETEFESLNDATACYQRILEIDSGNLPGIRNLERLLRSLGKWESLIEVFEHHIKLLDDNEAITEAYLQVGDIYYRELSRVDKAEQVYTVARDFNPQSEAALKALSQLYERSGNWFQSLDMLQRQADALGEDVEALPIWMRIGRINNEMLMDLGAAQNAYRRALEIDPDYGLALAALKEIAKSNEDWDAYSEYLIAEAESTDDAEEKTELFSEAARFHAEVRGDEEVAIGFYERALEITPHHLETTRALAEIHFRREAWEKAGDLYQLVLAELDKSRDAKDYGQKHYRLGYIQEKLGDEETALNHYRESFDADATYLPALEGLAQALLSVEEWEEAQRVFQTILIHHRESLTESEVVDVQWQIGDVMLRQDQPDRAYKQFEKSLEIDPDHAPSLEALAELDERMENWDGASERLSCLAEAVTGPKRDEVLMRLSDIARDHLSNTSQAVEALERARRGGAPPIDLLLRLADSYTSSHQHQKAFEVLEQAVGLAEDPGLASDMNYRSGQVLEQHIKNDPMALQRYNAALDASPQNVAAFEALEKLLVRNKQWGLLEQNYREMIARSKGLNIQFRLVVWRSLAELYRRVLNSIDDAIAAYEAIVKLDPGKVGDLAILAELYAEKPEHRLKAITMLHELVPALDNPIEALRKLRKLYHANRQFDEVFVIASALVCLKAANDEEVQVFDYLKRGVPARATQSLLDEGWAVVAHPSATGSIATMVSVLYQNAPDSVTHPARDLNLSRRQLVDVRSSDLYFAGIVRYVAKVLNIPPVDFYRKSGSMEALQLAPAQPPALVVGENNNAYRETDQRMAIFNIARMVSYAKPEFFLARVYPGSELRNLLFGICLVFNRSLKHNGEPREVERWLSVFERLPQTALRRLQAPAEACYADLTQGTALQDFQNAVEITALRAGLVACGDLSVALAGAARVDAGAAVLSVQQRAQELVRFAVSRPYLQLRKAIGGNLVAQEES